MTKSLLQQSRQGVSVLSDTVPFVDPAEGPTAVKSTRRRRAFWRKFLFVLLLTLMICGVTLLYLIHMLHGFSNFVALWKMTTKFAADKVTHTPPFNKQRKVNILILGTDVDFGCSRSDTMKFVHLDLDSQRISILSIPRDTWVLLPNGEEGRINGAYSLGGQDRDKSLNYAKEAVETLLTDMSGQPVHIDYFLRMQTDQFQQVVDALGGVDLNVEKQMDYEDPSQDLHIHLAPGLQHLDGYNTMCYVRFRHDDEGDYGRIRRQNQFLRALTDKLHNLSSWQKLSTIGPILKMTYTNLSANDILATKQLADAIGMNGMQMLTMPTVPTFKGAASVVEIQDPIAAAGTVCDVLHGPRVTVALANGAKPGMARHAIDEVDPNLFNVLGTGTVRHMPADVSHIFAPVQYAAQAQALAVALGIPPVIDTTSPLPEVHFDSIAALTTTAQITVVLGDDFHPRVITALQPVAAQNSLTRDIRRMQISRHRGRISRTTGGTEPIGVTANRPTDLTSPRRKKGEKPDGTRPSGADGNRGLLRHRDRLVPGQ